MPIIPPIIRITHVDSTEGKFVIHWEKSADNNFTQYRLTKYCYRDNSSSEKCVDRVITDVNATYWVDPDYIGGQVMYRIDAANKISETPGEEFHFNWNPGLTSEMVDGFVTARWRSPFFYTNLWDSNCRLSPSGEYFVESGKIYHFENGAFVIKGNISSSTIGPIYFVPGEKYVAFEKIDAALFVREYDLATSTQLRSTFFNADPGLVQYDPQSNAFLLSSNSGIRIYNVNNPTADVNKQVSNGYVRLINRKLFYYDWALHSIAFDYLE